MRKLLLPIAAVALLPLGACDPGSSSSSASGPSAGTPVKVGVPPDVDAAALYLGQAEGFFARHQIDLEPVTVAGAESAMTSLVSGGLQFSWADATSVILAGAQSTPVRMVAAGDSSTGDPATDFSAVVVPADSAVTSAKDLAGKTVAVDSLRNLGEVMIRDAVAKDGGDAKSVKFVELSFSDMPWAVANHQVDAAWVVEPYLSAAMAQGARMVASPFCSIPDLTVGAYVTTQQYLDEHEDVVRNFRAAVEQSLRYASEHPDEARGIVSTYAQVPSTVVATIKLPAFPQQVGVESLRTVSSLMSGYGITRGTVDVSTLLATG